MKVNTEHNDGHTTTINVYKITVVYSIMYSTCTCTCTCLHALHFCVVYCSTAIDALREVHLLRCTCTCTCTYTAVYMYVHRSKCTYTYMYMYFTLRVRATSESGRVAAAVHVQSVFGKV